MYVHIYIYMYIYIYICKYVGFRGAKGYVGMYVSN